MKNCIYFAGSGQFSGPRLAPGWGFTETGQPRFGDGTGDGVLLDDRWPPAREAIGRMADALRGAGLIVCDFEKAPTPLLADLLARLEGRETVVPESCAALPHSAVLVGPYRPPGSFLRWLDGKRRRYGPLVLDAEPIRVRIPFRRSGRAPEPEPSGAAWFCGGARCLCARGGDGFVFRDTRESLAARCAAAAVPAIVFEAAWAELAEEAGGRPGFNEK